jgi:flagellar basal body P-ring formation protein FlgA
MKTPHLLSIVLLLAGSATTRAQEQLRPYVEAYLNGDDSPWRGYEIENLGVDAPRDLIVPVGAAQVDLETRSVTAGSLLLYARISAPGVKTRETWVRVHANLYARVAVAARAIARGQELGANSVRLERRPIRRLTPLPIRGLEEVEGLQVRRPLAPGTILTDDLVEAVPLVRRGDVLRLLATSGPLRVAVEAQALEDGVRGQRIRVKNISSGKVLVAEVSGPREASVLLP